jgi:hypothetical protein
VPSTSPLEPVKHHRRHPRHPLQAVDEEAGEDAEDVEPSPMPLPQAPPPDAVRSQLMPALAPA